MTPDAPRLRILDVRAFERPVTFRFPFRFGAARVTAASQAFLRIEIADATGAGATGWAAEMMMPKWFDKNPALTAADNEGQLRRALSIAMALGRDAPADTAFGLHAALEPVLHRDCGRAGLPALVAAFGLALLDRAVLDALCRLGGRPAVAAIRANLPGIDTRTAPDLAGFDLAAFLATRPAPAMLAARHTVGLGDALTEADVLEPLGDGLPENLEAVVAAYGHRFFKLKVSGDVETDLNRLARIAAVLDALAPGYRATLDGNEQFADPKSVAALLEGIEARPELAGLRAALLFLEQPIARARALDTDMGAVATRLPLAIDESDGTIDAFPAARARGYAGVSVKSCKGFYRGLLNAARVAQARAAGGSLFLSAEDLTVQPGIALAQDLVLAALAGANHAERNGHHFVDGFGAAPLAEQEAFAAAHPDLYARAGGHIRLRITDGTLPLGTTLAAPGLGTMASPDPADLQPMAGP
jgi:L-alanine-DL-glutamate epimerase-like enolase superfamily enzyme